MTDQTDRQIDAYQEFHRHRFDAANLAGIEVRTDENHPYLLDWQLERFFMTPILQSYTSPVWFCFQPSNVFDYQASREYEDEKCKCSFQFININVE